MVKKNQSAHVIATATRETPRLGPDPALGRFSYMHATILVFFLVAMLAIFNLAQTPFWGDEADVGILARNLNNTGKLTAWDGRNLYGFRNGTLLKDDLTLNGPPLQYFVTAIAFRFLGTNTWTGRFPFVVFGLLSLWVLWLMLKEDFEKYPMFRLLALCMVGFSLAFIMNIRQCRYYALSLFLSLLSYFLYKRSTQTRSWRSILGLSICCILGFYTNYLLLIPFVFAMGCAHLLFYRQQYKFSDWPKLASAAALFLAFVVPYAVSNRIWHRPDMPVSANWISEKLTLLWWNFRDLNRIAVMPWMLLTGTLGLCAYYRRRWPMTKPVLEWLTIGSIFTIGIVVLNRQPINETVDADVRYLIPAYPFFTAVMALPLWHISRQGRRGSIVAALLFVIAICTNAFTLGASKTKPGYLLPNFIKEITNPYPTSLSATIEYLKTHAAQDDVVFAFPDYYAFSLYFYLGDQILARGFMSPDTPLGYQKVMQLDPRFFAGQDFPNWLIFYGPGIDQNTMNYCRARVQSLEQPHMENGRQVRYKYVLAENLPIFFAQTHRPELFWHSFGPWKNFNPNAESVLVLKRMRAD